MIIKHLSVFFLSSDMITRLSSIVSQPIKVFVVAVVRLVVVVVLVLVVVFLLGVVVFALLSPKSS